MQSSDEYVKSVGEVYAEALKAIDNLPHDHDALVEGLPVIAETYGNAAAELAASYYMLLRSEAGIEDDFEAEIPGLEDFGIEGLLGASGEKAQSPETFMSLVKGGMQRRVANQARRTISENSFRDPRARGWRRVGTPDCDFCEMLIGRGTVYTKRTAHFAAHDNCDCMAVPDFDKSQLVRVDRVFTPSKRR